MKARLIHRIKAQNSWASCLIQLLHCFVCSEAGEAEKIPTLRKIHTAVPFRLIFQCGGGGGSGGMCVCVCIRAPGPSSSGFSINSQFL